MISIKIEGLDRTIKNLEQRFGKASVTNKIRAGMRASKPEVKRVLGAEMRRSFKVRKPQFADKTWRISTGNRQMEIKSLVRWLGAQSGDTIRPRGHQALLIPINTYLGSRITTKKFYSLIDWLHQNKRLVFKHGIAYAVPEFNTSRRGGVGVGTRINKKFRSRMQGSIKRPSGFSMLIKNIDGERLIPIAAVRRSIRMPKRFVLADVARRSIVGIVEKHISEALSR